MERTQAIKSFLEKSTHSDLASLYNIGMECQVNVAQDGGERAEGEYKGKKWLGWTDDFTTWKAFRIPYHADTIPEYTDREIGFDLFAHAEGIGMTGWDWKNKVSKWMAFDFDAITGHSDRHAHKLTPDEMQAVRDTAIKIPWVTVRYSTSGKGLHLYVFVDDIPTENHTEHAALARCILSMMSGITGFDFKSKVDICGGNMWVWHRKMKGTNGLQVIKHGEKLPMSDIPSNWRDHVKVVTGRKSKATPVGLDTEEQFEQLTGQQPRVKLTDGHKKLLEFLKDNNCLHWWNQDHYMLIAHTFDLKRAHTELGLTGFFETVATGTNRGADHNCFLFPMRNGSWGVRRYTRGAKEHETWEQDGSGWTRTYLNREPDFGIACRAYGGVESPKGGYVFREAEQAAKAALALGIDLEVQSHMLKRACTLKQGKEGKLVVELGRESSDPPLANWLEESKRWIRVYHVKRANVVEHEVANHDDLIRHVITSDGIDDGWVVHVDGHWNDERLAHVTNVMKSIGLKAQDVEAVIGGAVMKPWKVVNIPFAPEYPGDRRWNKNAPQFQYPPTIDIDNLSYPSWTSVLEHVGRSLNQAVMDDVWCKASGLKTGGDYLKLWIASVFQRPFDPTPYLFLYGPQGSGKSIFHEMLSLLVTKGYVKADEALRNTSGFNGELKDAILCTVEETDLKANKQAYNRIKDWVTALQVSIHAKGMTPYMIDNSTHWIQCSNDLSSCPIFPGDTRITVAFVDELQTAIPKNEFLGLLKKEAPDFLAEILHMELPRPNDRLAIPVLNTAEKLNASRNNQSRIEDFLEQRCFTIDGEVIPMSEFYEAFKNWLDPVERTEWTKQKMSKAMPSSYIKGRYRGPDWHWGNVSFTDIEPTKKKLVATTKDTLVHEE